ncbi:MAG: lipoate--protein ligase family protein [Firmicutes bacterium]|nr:lipoate--protein ligase family protein [Bacillota bacterium]
MIGRLLPWSTGTGPWNMALDEALLLSYEQGKAPPTLRFYGWDPPALSLGCFQQPLNEEQQRRFRLAGVDWVKRPTGGRAVFHEDELTYALVAGEREGFTGPVLADYQKIGLGFKRGFALLGLTVELAPGARQAKGLLSQACFAAPSWSELTCQGRKLVGSAQLRHGKALLQHGSILLSFNPWFWREVWAEAPAAEKNGGLARKVIGLREALGRLPARSDVIAALCQGLSEELGIEWQEGDLSAEELSLAARLRAEKYTSADWNNRRGRKGLFGDGRNAVQAEEASG